MGNPLYKKIEIAFRRNVVRTLSVFVRRERPYPINNDFNHCKFLFVRQDMIGDVLVSTPLFEILKRHYPDAAVDVLLSSSNHFVLANDPLIRKRWIYDKRIGTTWRLVNNIRRERYDFVIDLMDNPSTTSTLFCLLAGGRRNVGLEKDNAYAYDIVIPLQSRRDTHIIERIAQLLVPFHIDVSNEKLSPRYFTSAASEESAKAFISENGLENKFNIGINISAGDETRYWGTSKFQELIRYIRSRHADFRIIVLFKPSDFETAATIQQPFPEVVLSPRTDSFDQFASLIRRLNLLVTPDTSAVHLAAAFNIPSIVLYVQSNKDLRIWEPYQTLSECLVTNVDDLSTIPSSDVAAALEKILRKIRVSPTTHSPSEARR